MSRVGFAARAKFKRDHAPLSLNQSWDAAIAEDARRTEARRKRPHTHEYLQHPTWATHYCCRICGFAIVKSPSTDKLAVKEPT